MTPPDPTQNPRPFEAPWQAQAFAMTVALHEAGHFTWAQWAKALSAQIHADPGSDGSNDAYYGAWLRALETILAEIGTVDPAMVAQVTQSWHRAARATPHGTPITLAADPAR